MERLIRLPITIWIFLLSTIYYGVLSAKTYTWVFISSDSGDWLAASNMWLVPQPYGSPLYILLGQFLNLFPGDLVIKMTIILSVIPSAVTVMLIYLIVRKMTNKQGIAVASSLVLLGSAIFLTQSTILEEYALTTMLLTLSFWTYINNRRLLTALCWGLAVAIHVFVLGAILFWLIIEWRRYTKPLMVVTLPLVAVFYGFILLLMYLDTPRLLAGGLNVYSLKQYLTVTTGAILGQLSMFDAPKRLLLTSQLLLMSFGVASVPLLKSIKKPISKPIAVMLGIILWTYWYQITNIDVASWTFITYASPSIAILVGIGLSHMKVFHLKVVVVGALILIVVNGMFLNANKLTNEKPLATDYYEALQALPDGSIVLASSGSHSLGLYYAMSEGKDLVPLIYPYLDDWEFWDYYTWLQNNYDYRHSNKDRGIIEPSTFDTIAANIYTTLLEPGYEGRGVEVYYASTPWRQSDTRRCLVLEDTEWTQIKKVTGLTGLEPEPFVK